MFFLYFPFFLIFCELKGHLVYFVLKESLAFALAASPLTSFKNNNFSDNNISIDNPESYCINFT